MSDRKQIRKEAPVTFATKLDTLYATVRSRTLGINAVIATIARSTRIRIYNLARYLYYDP
jgi:hypothetical protein